jgi:long-chain acyl-CoA synthetase
MSCLGELAYRAAMTADAEPADFLAELRRVASRQPDAPALVDDTTHVTYAEMVAEVDRRAGALRGAGLRPRDRVALVAENSAAFLIAAFAVWSADGVLATVYPSTGIEDLRYTLDNADPVLVMVDATTRAAAQEVAPAGVPVALIDERDLVVAPLSPGRVPDPDLREPVHLICYSSGTTSRPKAIMLSRSAIYNGARTYADVWRLSPADRTIVCLPMAWLFGLNSTSMSTLLAGGSVIALRRARPDVVVAAIEQHGATFLPAVTTVFAKLVEHLGTAGAGRGLGSLRLAVSGGEPRNEAAFARFQALAGVPVHDTFCASECFPLITYDPVLDPQPVPGSAGRLVPRSELRILDAAGSPARVGEVGEAFSRGAGLMLGYWRDPEQTAAAFTEDGWFRTKDLVRMDEDGFVYVVGRLSDMIIRGGSNVSPAEVERALRKLPEVRDVAVVGLPDPVYGEEVTAAVVLADGFDLDGDRLRQALASDLASYKVPTRWCVLEHLPVSPTTGKVDRRAVAALATEPEKELT